MTTTILKTLKTLYAILTLKALQDSIERCEAVIARSDAVLAQNALTLQSAEK